MTGGGAGSVLGFGWRRRRGPGQGRRSRTTTAGTTGASTAPPRPAAAPTPAGSAAGVIGALSQVSTRDSVLVLSQTRTLESGRGGLAGFGCLGGLDGFAGRAGRTPLGDRAGAAPTRGAPVATGAAVLPTAAFDRPAGARSASGGVRPEGRRPAGVVPGPLRGLPDPFRPVEVDPVAAPFGRADGGRGAPARGPADEPFPRGVALAAEPAFTPGGRLAPDGGVTPERPPAPAGPVPGWPTFEPAPSAGDGPLRVGAHHGDGAPAFGLAPFDASPFGRDAGPPAPGAAFDVFGRSGGVVSPRPWVMSTGERGACGRTLVGRYVPVVRKAVAPATGAGRRRCAAFKPARSPRHRRMPGREGTDRDPPRTRRARRRPRARWCRQGGAPPAGAARQWGPPHPAW